jgi:predicted transcriptional regulator
MAMAATNAFGTFLETKQLLREGPEEQERGPGPSPAAAPPEPEKFNKAVQLLLKGTLPSTLPRLWEASGLSLDEFKESIDMLEQSGLIAIEETDGHQVATLTALGQTLGQKLVTA